MSRCGHGNPWRALFPWFPEKPGQNGGLNTKGPCGVKISRPADLERETEPYTGQTKVALLEGPSEYNPFPLESFGKRPTGVCAVNFGPGKSYIILNFKQGDN